MRKFKKKKPLKDCDEFQEVVDIYLVYFLFHCLHYITTISRDKNLRKFFYITPSDSRETPCSEEKRRMDNFSSTGMLNILIIDLILIEQGLFIIIL